jgi:hypothetical protein
MAGPIVVIITRGEDDENPMVVAGISAFEAQAQIVALEAQAISMSKLVRIIAELVDIPKPEPGEEDKGDA